MSKILFDNNLVVICKSKVTLMLNKPTYVGMCILDSSKVLMSEFHFGYIKNNYDKNSRLLFTDTDSLMYEIKTEDVYEDFNKNKEIIDVSNYTAEVKHDDSNKLVLGKMKMKQVVSVLKNVLFHVITIEQSPGNVP